MVREFKKPNPSIKIIPVFYFISRKEWQDEECCPLWISKWQEWANKDKRINVEEWKEALKCLKPINSMVMIKGTSAMTSRREIVEVVCQWVLPEIRWNDFHIQGRLRLCQDVMAKIHHLEEKNGVQVLGLYGMGGIGKSTVCKAVCNELFQKFHGRVCHIEMKSASEAELFREVFKRLTNTRHELLHNMDVGQCRDQLRRCMVDHAIFLAIDNVSDDPEVLRQAKTYLGAKWSEGSIVLVTARSLGELKQCIDQSNCVGMPELKKDEAKKIFLQHVSKEDAVIEMDEQLIDRCVQRCYFSKGEGKGHHYIPLALQGLGEQLGCIGYNPELWLEQLEKIHSTFDHWLLGHKHPIFSILRTSYDCSSPEARMLFLDVALYLPWMRKFYFDEVPPKWNFFEWLSMVHGSNVKEIRRQLEGLKRKSLLEDLGDGITNIVMHDLWHEFCMVETKVDKFGDRRWVFLEEESTELAESSPSGCCWENLKRMCFMNEGWRSLHGVHLNDYANVTVLKLEIKSIVVPSALDLDLRGLKHLKSLDLKTTQFFSNVVGLGSLRSLVFLSWIRNHASNSLCIEEIRRLTKLLVLELEQFTNAEMPDMSMLTSLRVASLRNFRKAVTITGLSSQLTNLRSLNLGRCKELQDCPGLVNYMHWRNLICRDVFNSKKCTVYGC